jgi:hypothetical protein
MKQSEVKPGICAMLSLGGRRGAVAVTVIRRARWEPGDDGVSVGRHWLCQDSSERQHVVTARQLQPMPAPVAYTETHGGVVYEFRTGAGAALEPKPWCSFHMSDACPCAGVPSV